MSIDYYLFALVFIEILLSFAIWGVRYIWKTSEPAEKPIKEKGRYQK